MSKNKRGELVNAIMNLIRETPSTSFEVSCELGIKLNKCSATLSKLHKTKRLCVIGKNAHSGPGKPANIYDVSIRECCHCGNTENPVYYSHGLPYAYYCSYCFSGRMAFDAKYNRG